MVKEINTQIGSMCGDIFLRISTVEHKFPIVDIAIIHTKDMDFAKWVGSGYK